MKNKIKKSLGNLSKKVTTADKITMQAIFDKALEEHPNPSADKYKQSPESDIFWANMRGDGWISKIEAYCGELGILPNDLIETHRQSLKMAKKGLKEGNKGIVAEALADKRFQYNPNDNPVWLKKMGKTK